MSNLFVIEFFKIRDQHILIKQSRGVAFVFNLLERSEFVFTRYFDLLSDSIALIRCVLAEVFTDHKGRRVDGFDSDSDIIDRLLLILNLPHPEHLFKRCMIIIFIFMFESLK
jgi:hypothetical protein